MILGIPSVVFWAVVSMLALGTLFGLGLIVAARAFAGQDNPLVEQILEALPGINCGACGYKGCRAYAEAVAGGEKVNLCVPGGPDVAEALSEMLGVEAGETVRLRAVVHCQGGAEECGTRFVYNGEQDCLSADILSGGPKDCAYGCLGYGSCAEACPFDAITMSDDRLPVIDPEKCTACGVCVRTCPRELISLVPMSQKIYLGCSSHDKGKAVRSICSVGCIACRMCERKDPAGAISMSADLPILDYDRAEDGFATAASVCPMNCFVVEEDQKAEAEDETPADVEALA